MTNNTMIEAMARAIWEIGAADDLSKDDSHFYAKAALGAINDAGFVIVPVEPTFDMKMEGANAITADHMQKMANYDAAIDCYRAMINAARNP